MLPHVFSLPRLHKQQNIEEKSITIPGHCVYIQNKKNIDGVAGVLNVYISCVCWIIDCNQLSFICWFVIYSCAFDVYNWDSEISFPFCTLYVSKSRCIQGTLSPSLIWCIDGKYKIIHKFVSIYNLNPRDWIEDYFNGNSTSIEGIFLHEHFSTLRCKAINFKFRKSNSFWILSYWIWWISLSSMVVSSIYSFLFLFL